MIDYYNKSA